MLVTIVVMVCVVDSAEGDNGTEKKLSSSLLLLFWRIYWQGGLCPKRSWVLLYDGDNEDDGIHLNKKLLNEILCHGVDMPRPVYLPADNYYFYHDQDLSDDGDNLATVWGEWKQLYIFLSLFSFIIYV